MERVGDAHPVLPHTCAPQVLHALGVDAAAYNGTAPIEAPSGDRVRHRLIPRRDRQLNWAIQVIAISRLRYDAVGRTFYDCKIEEGKTFREALRALKRRVSDTVDRHLVDDARQLHG